MNAIRAIVCTLLLAPAVPAQQPAASAPAAAPAAAETIHQLSTSAGQELAKSIEDLNHLRRTIAEEKLPLAQELTSAEEQIAELRRENERVTRLVDEGNLEVTTIKAEMKARQEELTYLGNLLDEYARSSESKLNVGELQYCGAALETAKQATENTTLSMSERFERQVAFVEASIARVGEAIGGMRFPGVAVDLQGTLAEGQFAILGPVALFLANNGSAAGLAIAQSGSTRPLIRPLEGAIQTGLVALVQTGEGLMPLDPSRGGALKALVQRTNIIHIFQKGGPVMWPLLVASILALATVLERVFFLMNERRKRDPRALEAFFAQIEKGDTQAAALVGRDSKDYVVRTLTYAIDHKEQSLPNALLLAQSRELKRFRRGIPILDTVITLAPLLGLLGTVTGMMGSFSLIGGELSSPGAITGGIAEALIATAFGLGIAITALLPFNFLNTKLDEASHEIESAATQLELLVHPQVGTPAAVLPLHANGASAPHDARARAEAAAAFAASEEEQRKQREAQRKRLELQKQIEELQMQLDEDGWQQVHPGGKD